MNPSLTDVLQTGQAAHSHPHNLMFYMAAAAAFLVATLVARGVSVLRRNRWTAPAMDDTPSLLDIELKKNGEKIEKLTFMVDELKREKESLSFDKGALALQNEEMQDQLGAMEDLKQSYEIMYKGNLTLARECDKLKTEKEELTLKANQPLVRTKTLAQTAKKIKNKKGVVRKPKRVSRKGK